mmetsp:Transcript_10203/g.62214  ORF Transcript_10203/g.62214 Transcript_10203/m.62214 type:complete len:565 (+) Transcript_10203:2826-4520(+)
MATSDARVQASDDEADDAWIESASCYRCLACEADVDDLRSLVRHLDERHELDLRQVFATCCEGLYDRMRVVNYVRQQAAHGCDVQTQQLLPPHDLKWKQDAYLRPFMEDDPLLMELDSLFPDDDAEEWAMQETDWKQAALDAQEECQRLREELAEAGRILGLDEEIDPKGTQQTLEMQPIPSNVREQTGPQESTGRTMHLPTQVVKTKCRFNTKVDVEYFASYSDMAIHREMLGDRPRTLAYQTAIEGNSECCMQDARVMDIGCGTGILSLMAARAGAANVVAIDASTAMAEATMANAKENGYDEKIEVINEQVEKIDGLPKDMACVDVIVSEWMGYGLLFESMLDDVMTARDLWLKPGGAVLPDVASLHVAGAGPQAGKDWFWKDVYGFKMSSMGNRAHAGALHRASVEVVNPAHLITDACAFHTIDVALDEKDKLEFSAPFQIERLPKEEGRGGREKVYSCHHPLECHVLVLWFEAHFTARFCRERPVTLSTSPLAEPTHWAQVALTLAHPVLLTDDVVGIQGTITFSKNRENRRSVDIVVKYAGVRRDGSTSEQHTQLFDI